MSIWQPVSRLPVPRKEIILYCVWLYFRFGVSFRDVEEMMALRGEQVSYETVGRWCDRFSEMISPRVRNPIRIRSRSTANTITIRVRKQISYAVVSKNSI